MICFRDRVYCSNKNCSNSDCYRFLSESEKEQAEKLKLPICFADFSEEGCFRDDL